MGTSRNDSSPDSPPWKPALAVLGTPRIPVERQCVEIWRAAVGDRGDSLFEDLSNPAIASGYTYVAEGMTVAEAIRNFDSDCMKQKKASFAMEMARRALARCVATGKTDKPKSYGAELFAEAVSYYASRDLPSFVGAAGRISNISELLTLKQGLREVT